MIIVVCKSAIYLALKSSFWCYRVWEVCNKEFACEWRMLDGIAPWESLLSNLDHMVEDTVVGPPQKWSWDATRKTISSRIDHLSCVVRASLYFVKPLCPRNLPKYVLECFGYLWRHQNVLVDRGFRFSRMFVIFAAYICNAKCTDQARHCVTGNKNVLGGQRGQ